MSFAGKELVGVSTWNKPRQYISPCFLADILMKLALPAQVGNVDSACGVVPVHQAHQSDWVSSADYEADAFFYRELSERLPRTYFVPYVIYQYSGSEHQREGESETIWDLPSG